MDLLAGGGPLYKRLTAGLQGAILDGRLKPGEKLPSSRSLSAQLGISRNAVVQAYEQLVAEGFAVAKTGAGSFVSASLPAGLRRLVPGREAVDVFDFGGKLSAFAKRALVAGQTGDKAAKPAFDFQYGEVVPEKTARHQFARCLREALGRTAYGYSDPRGLMALRDQVARYLLSHRGLAARTQDIQIVNGSQQGLDILSRALIETGDQVVMEDPHYQGARHAFEAAGANIIGCPVDDQGLIPEALPKASSRIKMIYVTPSHQFPTGAVMSLARRLKLLEWAGANGVIVVEDDYDSEYRYETSPVSPLKSLDKRGQVVYLGTFAKALFPGLRLGYLIAPPAFGQVLARIKWLSDRGAPTLLQAGLANFIESGGYERHIRRTARIYGRRYKALVAALGREFGGDIGVMGSPAGLHILVWFNKLSRSDVPSLIAKSREMGVGVYPLDQYYLKPAEKAGLLMGFATIEEDKIAKGVGRLAEAYQAIR